MTKEDWLNAPKVQILVHEATGDTGMEDALLNRLATGLIRARASVLIVGSKRFGNYELPKEFWARDQSPQMLGSRANWASGDFETWVKGRSWRAYGVMFSQKDIFATYPVLNERTEMTSVKANIERKPVSNAGRKPAAWWDDLWIEVCRQIYSGELSDFSAAGIEDAMLDWLSKQDHHPSDGTIKPRAKKLAKVLKSVD